jgi:hypothetical protein
MHHGVITLAFVDNSLTVDTYFVYSWHSGSIQALDFICDDQWLVKPFSLNTSCSGVKSLNVV